MDTKTEAQIYLANRRGCTETDCLRSYHTFNFGTYVDESRQPFGPLQVLNDDLLLAGASLTMQATDDTRVILIPMVGGLAYKRQSTPGSLAAGDPLASEPAPTFLEPGQAGCFPLRVGMSYVISNPYETESINFLQLWLTETSSGLPPVASQTQFDLTLRNRLLPFFELTNPETNRYYSRGFIGSYDGRRADKYALPTPMADRPETGIYAFVLNGVFEVQNRLLHERDGLSLLNIQVDAVEFEALSNDALLLLLEVGVDG